MTALRTRQPTGAIAYPMILVEGAEKAGKTYAALSLSKDERIGRAFLFDFGEGSGDEYAPIGDYEIVEHDGTFTDFIGQLEAACAVPSDDGKPNLIVIDSVSGLWDALKVWAENRARRSRRGRELLAKDPDAEIDVPMNLWTDTNERWGRMVGVLRGWPGVAVLIARGREVAKVGAGGAPVAGQTEYRVEAQKSLPFSVTAQVRMSAPHRATLVAARSLTIDMPPQGLVLPDEAPLASLIFDKLGAGGTWAVPDIGKTNFGRTVAGAKNELVDLFTKAGQTAEAAKAIAAEVWKAGPCADAGRDDEVSDEAWASLVAAASVRLSDLEAK